MELGGGKKKPDPAPAAKGKVAGKQARPLAPVTPPSGKVAEAPAAPKGMTLTQIAAKINKSDPGSLISLMDVPIIPRLSTGVFPIDYQTGGGWLRGRMNIVWAAEGHGKSLLCYLTIRADQLVNPTKKQVVIDIEGRLDREWIMSLVLYPDNVLILQPITVEEAIDKAEAIIMATDVSLLIFDSIAMLITENELESEAGKAAVGGASNSIGKLMRKMTGRLNDLKRAGRLPTVLLVNQVRNKIGQLHGNPNHQPGGYAPKFMSSLTLWLYSKTEEAKGDVIPHWRNTTCTLHKWSTKVLTKTSEYNVCIANVMDQETGLVMYRPGQIYDWPLVERELKRLDLLVPAEKNGYNLIIYAEPKWFRVLTEVKDYYLQPENEAEYANLKRILIEVALVRTHGIPAQEEKHCPVEA